MIGQTIAQYHILEKLGEGGMGVVYKARDTRLDRFVALKLLPPERVGDPERKRRFVQEAKAASALNHPNIITIHEIASDGVLDFIVMEYVAGRTLDQMIGRRGLGPDETANYGVQIAGALARAHAAGIIHRDLKPANVMVTPDGLVKLLDFGLAKLLRPASDTASTETLTETQAVAGTLPYMAPEQLRGEAADARTDIWAVGAVLYELATGRRPFEAKVATALAADIQTKPPAPLRQLSPKIPSRLEEVILKCLEKDPEHRYQSANELRVDLSRPGATAAAAVPKRRPRGSAWWAWRVAVGAAAVVGVGVLVSLLRPQAQPPALTIRPATSFVGLEWGATYSPDASFLAYAHNRYGHMDVFVLPTGGGDPVRLTDDPADDLTPRWSPDGRYVAFVSDRGAGANVYLVPPLGGTERKLAETNLPWLEEGTSVLNALGALPWSPDASELLFSRLQPAGEIAIWKVNVRTGVQTQVTKPTPGAYDLYASWSFDGKRIAFWRNERGKHGLRLMDARGGEPELLLADEYLNMAPAWSPDSQRLVFVSNRGGPRNLWEIEVGSRRVRQLTSSSGSTALPAVSSAGQIAYTDYSHQVDLYWGMVDQPQEKHQRLTSHTRNNFGGRVSPDGQHVAYHSDRTGNYELWLLDRHTGAERNLTDHPAPDVMGDWSPDGREIVFLSNREGSLQVWVLEVESGGVRRISEKSRALPTEPHFSGPRWSPDGKAIGFVATGQKDVALWVVDPQGRNERAVLSGVMGFDWYRDSRHVLSTRKAADGSGALEMRVTDLETGKEATLLRGPTAEMVASRDGRRVAFLHSSSHCNMQLQVLSLVPPSAPGELPRPEGQPQQLTHGESAFHVHNGGWSPDGKAILYTRDYDSGDIIVMERR